MDTIYYYYSFMIRIYSTNWCIQDIFYLKETDDSLNVYV